MLYFTAEARRYTTTLSDRQQLSIKFRILKLENIRTDLKRWNFDGERGT